MERSENPVWENLRRREELRKAQTATGGRKNYVSPLELFRMQLDAEATGGEASTSYTVPEEENEQVQEGHDKHSSVSRDSDPDSRSSTLPPPSPDDCEAVPRLHRKSSHSYSETEAGEMPKGRRSGDQSVVFTKESWLKCMFPFKQCRKAMKSASRSLGLVDMSTTSKDTFFRNPLYNKNKAKAMKTNKVQGQVDDAASVSRTNKTKMSKMRSVEHSDESRKISAAVSCLGSDRRKVGNESARYHADDEGDIERSDGESFMGEPEFALLVEYYRRPKKFPFGREHSESSSPVVKQRSVRSVGALRKALLRTRHPMETNRRTASASPDPSKLHERSAAESHGNRQNDNERRDVLVVSHAQGRGKRNKKTSSPAIPEGIASQSTNGKVVGLMAKDLEKTNSNAGSRSQCAEDSSGGTGFTAFVPFQGFAAFANQSGAINRVDQPAMIQRSFESQCSSASGSRNTSRNNSRNSTHSRNSDRYYPKRQ